MKDKKNLISIGELAKITGVNIKCLRYYDRIGVLKPRYINPDTGYRYYSTAQLYLVETIQFCVELDIPLKELSGFLDEEQNLDFSALLYYGKTVAKKKIASINNSLAYIQAAQQEMDLARESINRQGSYRRELPERVILALPYAGSRCCRSFHTALQELLALGKEKEAVPLPGYGLLHLHTTHGLQSFIYQEIQPEIFRCKNVSSIPGGSYTCLQSDGCAIHQAPELFRELFSQSDSVVVVETELLCQAGGNQITELQALVG